MFSGIKSMIFGYTEPAEITEQLAGGDQNDALPSSTNNNSSSTATTTTKQTFDNTATNYLSQDASSLIEQTLNAATTKFTEQLLPQSPSIEQLQSSSHQLLPTLNEQHEEEEEKKRRKKEELEVEIEDDDECFNADSWELLDLVEKSAEVATEVSCTGLNSAVRQVEISDEVDCVIVDESSKSTSGHGVGILKPQESNKASAAQQRQEKPRVSFETPNDLVKKEKIERTQPKDNNNRSKKIGAAKGGSRRGKIMAKIAKQSNNKANDKVATTTNNSESKSSVKVESSLVKLETTKKVSAVKVTTSQKPVVLNYAAALTKKLNKDDGATSEGQFKKPVEVKGLQKANGAVKRNRPVSTSSWSSNDEDDDDDIWNDLATSSIAIEQPVEQQPSVSNSRQQVDNNNPVDQQDNESIISSGFSDCDYGYEAISDYVMRPKKAQNKRRGFGVSNSSSQLSLKSRRNNEQASSSSVVSSQTTVGGTTESMTVSSMLSSAAVRQAGKECGKSSKSANQSSWSSKHMKPKKKKMAPSSSCGEFLKKRGEDFGTQTSKPVVEGLLNTPVSVLPPPPPPTATSTSVSNNNSSSNDSSDLADMDESWYVTPPPCFTGANKLQQSMAGSKQQSRANSLEAAAHRENALIEHPSIYFANSSRSHKAGSQAVGSGKVTAPLSLAAPSNDQIVKQQLKPIVLRKVSKQQQVSAAPPVRSVEVKQELSQPKTAKPKRKSPTPPVQSIQATQAKAWENKFIVTNWNYDIEQDDINDFDNLFEVDEPSPRPKSIAKHRSTTKASKKQQAQQIATARAETTNESDSNWPARSPALIGVTEDHEGATSSLSSNDDEVQLTEMAEIEQQELQENLQPAIDDEQSLSDKGKHGESAEKKPLVAVRPIKPERLPGWQLRKKRPRRRPLGTVTLQATNLIGRPLVSATNSGRSAAQHQQVRPSSASSTGDSSGTTSARMSPTLIDRIQSSIVANLTQLAGFQAMARQAIEESADKKLQQSQLQQQQQTLARKLQATETSLSPVQRRQMSKGFLNRQNECAKVASSQRRADRRLKMHTTPNGYSINRKVQTAFH